MTAWYETVVLGNPLWKILSAAGLWLGAWAAGRIAAGRLRAALPRLSKKRGDGAMFPAVLASAARALPFLAFSLGFALAVKLLEWSPSAGSAVSAATGLLVTWAAGYAVYRFVDVIEHTMQRAARKTETRTDDLLATLVVKTLRVTVVVLTVVQCVTVLSDRPLASVLAGLGVGGLAVALAAQDTIKNFFGSIVLLADKPFEIGHRVVIDGHDGEVESIGLRSTRIRTLDGHLVTLPNGELANKTIQNIGARPHIRRVLDLALVYDTPPGKIEEARRIAEDLLRDHEGMRAEFPPRVFFADFAESSLNLRIIYWYHPPDYWAYTAFSEKLNLEILKRFAAAGIRFAFPSRTVYLEGGPEPAAAGGAAEKAT